MSPPFSFLNWQCKTRRLTRLPPLVVVVVVLLLLLVVLHISCGPSCLPPCLSPPVSTIARWQGGGGRTQCTPGRSIDRLSPAHLILASSHRCLPSPLSFGGSSHRAVFLPYPRSSAPELVRFCLKLFLFISTHPIV